MADTKDMTEKDVNEFLQKMVKKSEGVKSTFETLTDDSFNNFLMLVKQLWSEIANKDAKIKELNDKLNKKEEKK